MSVGAEDRGIRARFDREPLKLVSGGDVPDPQRLVPFPGRGESGSVRMHPHVGHGHLRPATAVVEPVLLPSPQVGDDDGPAVQTEHDPVAAWAEGDRDDRLVHRHGHPVARSELS